MSPLPTPSSPHPTVFTEDIGRLCLSPSPASECFHRRYRETVSTPSPASECFHRRYRLCLPSPPPPPPLPNVSTEDIGRLCLPSLPPPPPYQKISGDCVCPPPPPPPPLPNLFTENIGILCLPSPPASESFHRRYREAVHLIRDGLDPKLSPNEDRCEQMCPPTQIAYIWCRISLQPATLS